MQVTVKKIIEITVQLPVELCVNTNISGDDPEITNTEFDCEDITAAIFNKIDHDYDLQGQIFDEARYEVINCTSEEYP